MMGFLAAAPMVVAAGALAVGTVPSAGAGTAVAAAAATVHGTWQKLPAAPVSTEPGYVVSVWTSREMIVHGISGSGGVTFAYRPATRTWVRLSAGPPPLFEETQDVGAWTGSRMLVVGLTNGSYNPATNTWTKIALGAGPLDGAVPHGWTGRQFLAWGGTCCGGYSSDGIAYNPVTNTWTRLPPAPLERRADAEGAWTGKELVVAGGGKHSASSGFRDGAAYNLATGKWRKIAPMPAALSFPYGPAVWDGREVLFLSTTSARGLAYNPATNRWRYLPVMPLPRVWFTAVWTGHYVLVWGGLLSINSNQPAAHGEAYNPATNHWTALPGAPIRGRANPVAVWTGRQMIVWGGTRATTAYTDGAAFTPR